MSVVETIESVSGICGDTMLTFTDVSGNLSKQLEVTMIRMRTNYNVCTAIKLFVYWPWED